MVKGYNCPCCGKVRYYRTKQGAEKLKYKNCKSCTSSIKKGGIGRVYVGGKRKCCECGKYKLLKHFHRLKSGKYHASCNPCKRKLSYAYYKGIYQYSKYGIVEKDYFALLTKQEGKCAICEQSFANRQAIHIDHNHKSLKVRGLLCGLCNKGLGQFKDNISTLEKAIKYLKNG